MNQGLIPRRYAKALLMHASERKTDTVVYDAMQRLASAFASEPQLQRALANPAVTDADKVNLVMTASGSSDSADLKDFCQLLLRNHRIDCLRECALAYIRLYREAHRIYRVVITSAAPLQPAELNRIEALVKAHIPEGATADFDVCTNPDLIGGFTVSIDNELLDASVENELKQLRLKLLSH